MALVSKLSQEVDLNALPDHELERLYVAKAHAVQTGVGLWIERDPHYAAGGLRSAKHLRTGIDTSKADHGALARLLIDKGIITRHEFLVAIVDGVAVEAEAYEKRLGDTYGLKITLG